MYFIKIFKLCFLRNVINKVKRYIKSYVFFFLKFIKRVEGIKELWFIRIMECCLGKNIVSGYFRNMVLRKGRDIEEDVLCGLFM